MILIFQAVLGRRVDRPCVLPHDLADEIIGVGRNVCPGVTVLGGNDPRSILPASEDTYFGETFWIDSYFCFRAATTMTANDFYEAQARLDGAFCDYTAECKRKYLSELNSKHGVKNIEMEASLFAAMCHHAGVKGDVRP